MTTACRLFWTDLFYCQSSVTSDLGRNLCPCSFLRLLGFSAPSCHFCGRQRSLRRRTCAVACLVKPGRFIWLLSPFLNLATCVYLVGFDECGTLRSVQRSLSLALTCTVQAWTLKSSYNPPPPPPNTHASYSTRSAHRGQVLSWRCGTSGGVTPAGIKRQRQPSYLREEVTGAPLQPDTKT